MLSIWQILLLAIIQGAAELLPVSSSAHVIVAEKLMGLDPTTPELVLLLVMLHTGTMFAVIAYFWRFWRASYFQSRREFWPFAKNVVAATACTGALGLALKWVIEHGVFRGAPKAEVELLFDKLGLIAGGLGTVGLLIIYAGLRAGRTNAARELGLGDSCWIGLVQGLCLPFRGFSRSGATISTGLLLGAAKERVEAFSFALVVVLTPAVVAHAVKRLLEANAKLGVDFASLLPLFLPSLLGMAFSFLAGLAALRWLSRWLERGRWQLFGFYCLAAAAVVFLLYLRGY